MREWFGIRLGGEELPRSVDTSNTDTRRWIDFGMADVNWIRMKFPRHVDHVTVANEANGANFRIA